VVTSVRLKSDFRYVRVAVDPLYFNRLVSGGDGNAMELRQSFGITKSQIGHILGALVAESDAGNPGGLAFVEALAAGLSHQIATLAGVYQPRARRWRGGLSASAKSRVLELMDTRLDSNLSIDFLAREVGLSPAHFARGFKETMGIAPHRYLLQLRLERGRHLLENVDASLADVAQRSGFADQAHFTRLFKREYGVTPGIVLRSRRRLPPTRE
jgi:AraC family transcriptional regulator